jgi:phosphoribosylformylglycinamidine synthase
MYFGSMLLTFYPLNPNGSAYGVEAICSPDGRILGKMGHSERIGKNLYRNVYGKYDQKIFESGVNYFKKRQLN